MISYEKQENVHLGKSQPVYRLIVLPDHFHQSSINPFSSMLRSASAAACRLHGSIHLLSDRYKHPLLPDAAVSPADTFLPLHTKHKTAPRITGNTASPLVFSAFPYTRFVTRPASRAMSINISFCTSSTILLSCVKKRSGPGH